MKQNQSIQSSRTTRVTRISLALAALLGMGAIAHGWSIPLPHANSADTGLSDDGRGTPYKVDKIDNLCGLAEPRQLSKPAKVDYDVLLEATDEYREIRDKKIDLESARGVEVHNKAHSRIVAACERARTKLGHCSVWKTISRRNGKPIPNLTKSIKLDLAEGV